MINKKVKSNNLSKCPKIKDFDTRCSSGCYKNWTKFNQQIPCYQICECNKAIIIKKNGVIIAFNPQKIN